MLKTKARSYITLLCLLIAASSGAWLFTSTTNPSQPRVEVLLYHELQPGGSEEWPVIDPNIFYEQLNTLLEHGWQPLTLEEFAAWQQGEMEVEKNSFLLTFDDGGESIYHHAYPFLVENKIPAVVFLIGKYHDPDHYVEDPIWVPKLNDEQIREMASSGIIQFQSHSYDLHYNIDGIPAALVFSPEKVLEDFKKSISIIGSLTGLRVYSIAYPGGEFSKEVLAMAIEAGFELGFAGNVHGPASKEEPMTIKRFPLDNISMKAFKKHYGVR